jgi:methylated-DNA-[protein]-cysteine S-methyltransferase
MAGPQRWFVEGVDHEIVPLLVATDARGCLVYVGLGAEDEGLERHAARHGATLAGPPAQPTAAARQLVEYFEGARSEFELELRPLGTEFQRAAWHALSQIPYGETRSYAQQAVRMGKPRAVRAVGRANATNPLPIVIPCHRVIGSDGSLTGFGGGIDAKRWLLAHESPQARFAIA